MLSKLGFMLTSIFRMKWKKIFGLFFCHFVLFFSSVHFSRSVMSKTLPPLWTSISVFLVHHQFLELAQTHVHRVGDATQASNPLSSPSPPAFNLSQHQGLFQWVSSSHEWPKYLNFRFSISPSKNTQDWLPLGWTGWIAFQTKRLSRVFSNTTV